MKKTKYLLSAVLAFTMVLSIASVVAFANVDLHGNEIIDTRPEVYVPPRDPVDTVEVGLETAMPATVLAKLPELPEGFNDPVEEVEIPEDVVALPDASFMRDYDVELLVTGTDFELDGVLPDGIVFDADTTSLYGRATQEQAGETFFFSIASTDGTAKFAMKVAEEEISMIEISDLKKPVHGNEPSYNARVTFMAGKSKIECPIEALSLQWEEEHSKELRVFDRFTGGRNYRLTALLNIPDGYKVTEKTLVTLNGAEVRFIPSIAGDRIVVYYFYRNVGASVNDYVVSYECSTVKASADNRYPKSVTIKRNIEPYNLAPVPVLEDEIGYKFGGWYENAACTVPFNFDTQINHNRTIYAKWLKIIDDVKLDIANLHQSENAFRPEIKVEKNCGYAIAGTSWIEAVDELNPDNDVIYNGDLLNGNTYTLRIGITSDMDWGVWDEDGVVAHVNGGLCNSRFSENGGIFYVYYPMTVIQETHTHKLQHHSQVQPSCEKNGTKEYWECRECKQLYLSEEAELAVAKSSLVIPALGHDYGEWEVTREATCKYEGKERRVCKNSSSHVETRVIEKLEHQWGDWEIVKEPTETADGLQQRICELCHSVEQESIPAGSDVKMGDIIISDTTAG